MTKFKVDDVVQGRKDSTGAEILTVYGKVSGKLNGVECGRYAVYRTIGQVKIQFSDDDTEGVDQRSALTPIAPLRSQISTMISKLEKQTSQYQQDKANEYANRLGISLLTALQNNLPLAETLMTSIRDDLVEDKASDIRTNHLIWAFASVLATLTVAVILGSQWFVAAFAGLDPDPVVWPNSWHAAAIGAIGAMFSIALQIRGRQVRIDVLPWDNASDAFLRVLVGATSGALLTALSLGKVVDISVNGSAVSDSTYLILIIAFAGGFTERLVADFLATIGLTTRVRSSAPVPANRTMANERNLLGNPPAPGSAASVNLPSSPAQPGTPASAPPLLAMSPKTALEEAMEPDDDEVEAHDRRNDDVPGARSLEPVG